MPKIVDRDARRREIVEAYLRLVARDGMENATTRSLAAELAVATGALWHYFTGFDEVLEEALRTIYAHTNERIAQHGDLKPGLPSLVAMVMELLPLHKETQDEALVVVNFWGRVTSDRHLGAFESQVEVGWRSLLIEHLNDARAAGDIIATVPVESIAELILVHGLGQQVSYVLQLKTSAPAHQRQLVGALFRQWITPQAEQRLAELLAG
ncbi:MAG TPA: TetR/AcrR family transcriptional regulator [Pseudolysinimonas sp.]|nr:TetR/AcrR family transcriptional regulator [Pseudolysinimonas sp.]